MGDSSGDESRETKKAKTAYDIQRKQLDKLMSHPVSQKEP